MLLYRDFTDTLRVGIQDAQFDAGQRLADGIGAKRLEIVQRERGACLGQAVTVDDGNAEIVEELHGRGLHECAAGDQGEQLAAESAMHVRKQHAAELYLRSAAGQHLVGRDHRVQKGALPGGQVRRTWHAGHAPDFSRSSERARRR